MDTIHPKGLYHVHAMALNVEIAAMTMQQIIVLSEFRVAVLIKRIRAFLISQVSTILCEPFLPCMTAAVLRGDPETSVP